MAVFRNAPRLAPCGGEASLTKTLSLEWQSPVFGTGEAVSGALTVGSFRPVFLRRRWPDVVVFGDKEFFLNLKVGYPWLYKSADGKVIRGNSFGGNGRLRAHDRVIERKRAVLTRSRSWFWKHHDARVVGEWVVSYMRLPLLLRQACPPNDDRRSRRSLNLDSA